MKQPFALALALLFICSSCGKEAKEGFVGHWEGKTTVTGLDGTPVESITKATISESGESYLCELEIGSLVYNFEGNKSGEVFAFKNAIISNISSDSSSTKTYTTGEARLEADTILIFENEIYAMQGTSVLYSAEYYLEMKCK